MNRVRSRLGVLTVVALMAACASPDAPRCEETALRAPLSAPARHLLGVPAAPPRNLTIRAREAELERSQRERRELGWAIAAEVLEPVAVELPDGSAERSVPRFSTWYDKEDVRRIFRHLDQERDVDARAARAPFSEDALDRAFLWNADAVLEHEAWPATRLAEYAASIDSTERANGLGGIERTIYGPRAARHLLSSYAALERCRGIDPDLLPVPPDDPPPVRALREVAALDACESAVFGPYFVRDGGSLEVDVEGEIDLSAEGGTLVCDGNVSCTVSGPARVTLVARARARTRATLEVRYDDAQTGWIPCLNAELPAGSTIVKADYRRVGFGFDVGVHDTSAGALRARRDGDESWGEGALRADPGPDAIHTVELPDGSRYRLVALHVMVKELDHWVWVTLFWSPDPDTDLGADRPAFAEGTPWASYKMCVVTSFAERDEDPAGGASDPSLGDALAAVHGGVGAPSWCSNPFLEEGPGNASTNCVGCHQHAGSTLAPEEILTGPDRGRALVRTSFPTDYVFGASDLVEIFLEP